MPDYTRLPRDPRPPALPIEFVTPAEFACRRKARGDMPAGWPRVAPILESPWPEEFGSPCDGQRRDTARYAVWTDEDTGDGYRLACAECLGGWVDAVTVRLRLGLRSAPRVLEPRPPSRGGRQDGAAAPTPLAWFSGGRPPR